MPCQSGLALPYRGVGELQQRRCDSQSRHQPNRCHRELLVSVLFCSLHPLKEHVVKPEAWHYQLDLPEVVVSLNIFFVLLLVILIASSSIPKTRKVFTIPLTPWAFHFVNSFSNRFRSYLEKSKRFVEQNTELRRNEICERTGMPQGQRERRRYPRYISKASLACAGQFPPCVSVEL